MGFVSLNSALTGIRAAQVGLDTTAHNVSNAHTPGYTRQRPNLSPRDPYLSPEGPIGTGVDVTSIQRLRDTFLDARVRTSERAFGELETRADLLERAEAVMAEPDEGISAEMANLWTTFEELSLAPSDGASRRQVLSALNALTTRIRSTATGWDQLEIDASHRLEVAITEVNDVAAEIASLNRAILDSSADGPPNDLMDRRDALVDTLARRIGATSRVQDDGSVRVSVAGMAIVSGTTATTVGVNSSFDVVHSSGVTLSTGGDVRGLQEFLVTDLTTLRTELDGFTSALETALNTQHEAGFTPADTAGGPLLTAAGDARNVGVVITDPNELAAAGSTPAEANDGTNAAALADLRLTSGLDDTLRGLITDTATHVAGTRRSAAAEEQLHAAATAARRDMHGVSVDEEMVAMITFQRAMEASSRVMSAIDQALDVLVNRTGVVGR